MKRTEWFPVSIKPVRDGVYEVETRWLGNRFSLYKDGFWRLCCAGVDSAASTTPQSCDMYLPGAKWRGLTCEGGEE